MRIELPPAVAEQLRRPLQECSDNGLQSPDVLCGQVRRGFWNEPGGTDAIWLLVRKIRPETARKIRRLIQNEFRPSREKPTTAPPK